MGQDLSMPIESMSIVVSDMEKSRIFYEKLLRLEITSKAPNHIKFRTPGADLELFELEYLNNQLGQDIGRIQGECRRAMIACNLATNADVDEVCARLKKHGVQFLSPAKLYEWNAYAAYFLDPDGHFVEIFSWNDGGPLDVVNSSDQPAIADGTASSPLTITSFCLFVTDLPQCMDFYTAKLSMDPTRLNLDDGFANFSGAGSDFSMWKLGWTENSIGYTSARVLSRFQGAVINCRLPTIGKVDEKYEELRTRGVEFFSAPANYEWGNYSTYCSDPEGNLWSLGTPTAS
jgi:catechol 2,3-dioxygenase-like lactoylglutathione lyase family enzyme